jgi:microcompartment protein CcmK/EutM
VCISMALMNTRGGSTPEKPAPRLSLHGNKLLMTKLCQNRQKSPTRATHRGAEDGHGHQCGSARIVCMALMNTRGGSAPEKPAPRLSLHGNKLLMTKLCQNRQKSPTRAIHRGAEDGHGHQCGSARIVYMCTELMSTRRARGSAREKPAPRPREK